MIKLLFKFSVMILTTSVFAKDLYKVDPQALEKTAQLLENRTQRDEAISKNKDANKADLMARDLMGDGQNLDQLYKAAAKIFRSLANQTGGDNSAMMQKLSQAQQDPQSFLKNLSPEQQQLIKKLAEQSLNNQAKPNP